MSVVFDSQLLTGSRIYGSQLFVGGAASVDVPLGTITVTGYAPTVTVGGSATIDVPLGTITVTGFAPSVDIGGSAFVDVPAGSIVLIAYAPSVSISVANVWTAVSVSTGTWTPQ